MNFEEQIRSFAFLRGQSAPQASHGVGVRALYRCPVCQCIWLQDGPSVLEVQAGQLARLAEEMAANLEHLPEAGCRRCLWQHGGGAVSIDEYDAGEGFGLCWELPHPVVIHATSAILSARGVANQQSPPDVLTRPETLRAVLRVLQDAIPPREIQALPDLFCQLQASQARPGFGQPGTEQWCWRGWACALPCPPLAGQASVVVMLALPRTEQLSPAEEFGRWQTLLGFVEPVLAHKE